jgi:Ras-related protein Rab-1A
LGAGTSAADQDFDFLAKTLLVGNSGVGKSCLLRRFADGDFPQSSTATIGCDFAIRSIDVDGRVAKLQIWDSAGQDRFRSITRSYYRGSALVLAVFDVTDESSFQSVPQWVREVQQNANEDAQLLLVANKIDSPARVVSTEQAKNLAHDLGVPLIETSAKDATNVETAFLTITRNWIAALAARVVEPSVIGKAKSAVDLGKTKSLTEKNGSCCTVL